MALPYDSFKILLGAFFLSACNQIGSENLEILQTNPGEKKKSDYVIDPQDPFLRYSESEIQEMFGNISCSGLSGGAGDGGSQSSLGYYDYGLRATMQAAPVSLENPDIVPWSHLHRYSQGGAIQIPGNVYFSNLNVPTRLFDTGFPKLGGGLVERSPGVPLIEFFRLDIDGQIMMSQGEVQESNWEFAVIADDGVRLKINGQTIIDDPLVTPPKLMCGTQSVFMAPEEPLSFELAYTQAPRYHIALVLLWRKVGSGPAETMCGYNGTNTGSLFNATLAWFDWRLPGSPAMPNFDQLRQRGWNVVGSQNFLLPPGDSIEPESNPCNSSYVRSVFAPE